MEKEKKVRKYIRFFWIKWYPYETIDNILGASSSLYIPRYTIGVLIGVILISTMILFQIILPTIYPELTEIEKTFPSLITQTITSWIPLLTILSVLVYILQSLMTFDARGY